MLDVWPCLFLVGVVAGCADGNDSSAERSSSSHAARSARAVASASASTSASSAAASASARPTAAPVEAYVCPANEKWSPKLAPQAKLEWSDKPKLSDAPKAGAFMSVGGQAFEVESVSLSVDAKQNEWTLSAKAGPLATNLVFQGEPKVGALVDESFGKNRGDFQVPASLAMAECFKQTMSYSGENARIVKLTRYDAKAQVADGVFVTTWQESFDKKRKFWGAGTFKSAKVNLY